MAKKKVLVRKAVTDTLCCICEDRILGDKLIARKETQAKGEHPWWEYHNGNENNSFAPAKKPNQKPKKRRCYQEWQEQEG